MVSGRVASACFGDLSSGLALGSSFTTAIFEIEGLFELERLMEEPPHVLPRLALGSE